jgi:adenylate cyclase
MKSRVSTERRKVGKHGMNELWQRLRERKLVQWALAYIAAAFALLQALDIVGQQFGWPDSVRRGITVALAIGFFVTVVLAWYHGERGAQRVSGTELLILALLLGIGGAVLWRAAPTITAGKAATEPAVSGDTHSVAVLPFINMSDDKSNAYFSDGISEEILNVLARIPDLHVAARTSSFSFRNQEKEIPTIAQELKVRMVLEGSVRKQGERVRVTAQLIDAGSGFHVWSQTYDRDLKDIFAIQDEIANAIAKELQLKLDTTHAGTTVPDTTDIGAYDMYLKGMALWAARRDLPGAIEQFRAALKKDPNYAKAWSGLALSYAILPEWAEFSYEESRRLGRDAAEHALALDPALPEPYSALGYMAGTDFRFATAHALFERAVAIAPSYASGYQWYGEMLQNEGDLDAGVEKLRKAVALDPKSSIVNSVYATLLYTAGHDDEALAACDAMVAAIDEEWCPMLHWDVALARRDNARARAVLEKLVAARGPEAVALFNAQMDALDGKGDVEAIAKKLMDAPDGQVDPKGITPMAATDVALWLVMAGRNDLAIERIARYQKKNPQAARVMAFDGHMTVLHCEPRFVELMRSLKVEEPHLAAACPKGH